MIYKYIDIKNFELISEKVYDFSLNKTSILQQNAVWNNFDRDQILECIPELVEAFKELGDVIPTQLTLFKVAPKTNISVHIDGGAHARLLWPIKNCKGSYTKFFKVEEADIEQRISFGPNHGKGTFSHIHNIENAKLLEEVELHKPIVFKPWIPHGIWTNLTCKEPRLTLTVLFDKSLEYLLK